MSGGGGPKWVQLLSLEQEKKKGAEFGRQGRRQGVGQLNMPVGYISDKVQQALRKTGLGCREAERGNARWGITGI